VSTIKPSKDSVDSVGSPWYTGLRVREDMNTDKNEIKLPVHLQAALDKYNAKLEAFGFTVTDVTPVGYGNMSDDE